jgi:hypothetical protein
MPTSRPTQRDEVSELGPTPKRAGFALEVAQRRARIEADARTCRIELEPVLCAGGRRQARQPEQCQRRAS